MRIPAWLIALAVTALALGAAFWLRPGRSGARSHYNLLLISLDTVRQDVLGCYGHRPRYAPATLTTPTLDKLAAAGVRMRDAYASSPWTLPSHMSLFTGEPPLVHGVETDLQSLGPSPRTLAEMLKTHGYQTVGLFSGPYLEPHWGFGKGFDRYRAVYGPGVVAGSAEGTRNRAEIEEAQRAGNQALVHELERRKLEIADRLATASHRDVNSALVTAAVLQELETLGRGRAPWFLFAHYFDAHHDYIPPRPYDTQFDPDYAGTITGNDYLSNPRIAVPDPNDPYSFERHASDRDVDHLVALYEGEVAWVDSQVGVVLERLDALGLAAKTLVVVVSDHGEEFFEHGGIGHRRTVYEEVLRVPMLLRLPGVLPAGQVVPGVVSTADLLPTIVDILELPPPEDLSSASFLPLIRGERPPAERASLSRLVTVHSGTATLDRDTAIPVHQIGVQEAFRQGALKITRSRHWPRFETQLTGELRAILDREADAAYRQESVSWIDVGSFPAEPLDRQSTDFSEPAARAMLDSFRATYGRLLRHAQKSTAAAPEEDAVRNELRGLGYVDGAEEETAPGSASLLLPLPGDAVGGSGN